MTVTPLAIPDVKLIEPRRFGDARGWFAETWSRRAWLAAGLPDVAFVQDNHSMSAAAGTVRALHYQVGDKAQAKLVRVVRGAVFDVAVDLRRGSPTFGKWCGARLSAEDGRQVFVPIGFAHGFATLTADTEFVYKVTADYSPPHERGVRWDDPALGIEWGVDAGGATVNERDGKHPLFADVVDWFE